jgi:tRNA(fMet)-specific endonuclease VapC
MLRYLLDTNICIDVIKRRPVQMLERFNRHSGHMAISAITLSELLHGVENSAAPDRDLAVVENFCGRLEVLPYGGKACLHYGQIRAAASAAIFTTASGSWSLKPGSRNPFRS